MNFPTKFGMRRFKPSNPAQPEERKMKRGKFAWKFLQWRDGKIVSQFDGSEWTIGKWRTAPAPVETCKGLNCSLTIEQAKGYVDGSVLAKVQYDGVTIKGDDKITCQKMKIVTGWHFTTPAWKAYEQAKAPAEKAYQEATAPAEKAYEQATATALNKIIRTLERII